MSTHQASSKAVPPGCARRSIHRSRHCVFSSLAPVYAHYALVQELPHGLHRADIRRSRFLRGQPERARASGSSLPGRRGWAKRRRHVDGRSCRLRTRSPYHKVIGLAGPSAPPSAVAADRTAVAEFVDEVQLRPRSDHWRTEQAAWRHRGLSTAMPPVHAPWGGRTLTRAHPISWRSGSVICRGHQGRQGAGSSIGPTSLPHQQIGTRDLPLRSSAGSESKVPSEA